MDTRGRFWNPTALRERDARARARDRVDAHRPRNCVGGRAIETYPRRLGGARQRRRSFGRAKRHSPVLYLRLVEGKTAHGGQGDRHPSRTPVKVTSHGDLRTLPPRAEGHARRL